MRKLLPILLIIFFFAGGNVANAALIDNVVSYWKMDDNSNDAHASNNGTDTSMTYSATGAILNNAAQFSGSGDISVAHASALNLESIDSSISLWIRPTDVTTLQYLMWKGRQAASNSNWYIRLSTAGKLQTAFSYNSDADYDYYPADTALSINTLYHIVITHNASTRTIKVYINNVEDGVATLTNGSAPTTANTTALLFGAQDPAGSKVNYYTGSQDEIGIWSRVLSVSEVSELYNSGSGFAYPFTASPAVSLSSIISLLRPFWW